MHINGENISENVPAPRSVDLILSGLACYFFTSVLAIFGVMVGADFVKDGPRAPIQRSTGLLVFANFDGRGYCGIIENGYAYDPKVQSNVAYFPAVPLVARFVSYLTGISSAESMLLVAHLCLAGVFVMMNFYMQERSAFTASWVLIGMGLAPLSFFFRMAYSESFFLLVTITALFGMRRSWPVPVIALLVGLASATRPVGVALLAPFFMHIFVMEKTSKGSWLKCVSCLLLACWGILAYMLFQWLAFNDPLAFAKTQTHFRFHPPVSLGEQVISLITLEPIWSVYDPASPCYWQHQDAGASVFFSVQFANPIFFLMTIGLIVLGGINGWLNRYEILLAAGLLLIPYLTRSHEMCMGSMGRYAAVVFPVYLVAGQILARMPAPAAVSVLAFSGFWMCIYAALFASWHLVY